MPVIDLYDDAAVDASEEYNNRWLAQLEPNGAIPVMMAPLGMQGGWHEYQPCPGFVGDGQRLEKSRQGKCWMGKNGVGCHKFIKLLDILERSF